MLENAKNLAKQIKNNKTTLNLKEQEDIIIESTKEKLIRVRNEKIAL